MWLMTLVQEESKIFVESEDQPERLLLDTKIVKDDGYQKQQGEFIRGPPKAEETVNSLVCIR